LQLQNSSALGVEVNPESYHALYMIQNLNRNWLFNFEDDILINIVH